MGRSQQEVLKTVCKCSLTKWFPGTNFSRRFLTMLGAHYMWIWAHFIFQTSAHIKDKNNIV